MSALDRIRAPRRQDGAASAVAGLTPGPERGRSRWRRKRSLYAAGVLIAAVIVFFSLNAVYGFTTGSSNAAGSRLTATVKRGTVLSSVSASGNVAVAQSASANFATSGTITAVYVSAGEHVKAGQALAKIDPTSARNTLASAKANLAMAESTLPSAESGLTTAQRDANTISIQQAQQALTDGRAAARHRPDSSRDGAGAARTRRQARLPGEHDLFGQRLLGLGHLVHRLGQRVLGLGQRVHRLGQRVHGSGASSGIRQARAPGSGSASAGSGSASTGSGSGTGIRLGQRVLDAQRVLAIRHRSCVAATGSGVGRGGHGSARRAHRDDRFRVGGWHVVCDVERERDAGRVGYDLLLRVRHVADESELDHSDRRCRVGDGIGPGERVGERAGARSELLLRAGRHELVGHDGRVVGPVHDGLGDAVVTTGQASSVGATGATLSGSVQPQGLTHLATTSSTAPRPRASGRTPRRSTRARARAPCRRPRR